MKDHISEINVIDQLSSGYSRSGQALSLQKVSDQQMGCIYYSPGCRQRNFRFGWILEPETGVTPNIYFGISQCCQFSQSSNSILYQPYTTELVFCGKHVEGSMPPAVKNCVFVCVSYDCVSEQLTFSADGYSFSLNIPTQTLSYPIFPVVYGHSCKATIYMAETSVKQNWNNSFLLPSISLNEINLFKMETSFINGCYGTLKESLYEGKDKIISVPANSVGRVYLNTVVISGTTSYTIALTNENDTIPVENVSFGGIDALTGNNLFEYIKTKKNNQFHESIYIKDGQANSKNTNISSIQYISVVVSNSIYLYINSVLIAIMSIPSTSFIPYIYIHNCSIPVTMEIKELLISNKMNIQLPKNMLKPIQNEYENNCSLILKDFSSEDLRNVIITRQKDDTYTVKYMKKTDGLVIGCVQNKYSMNNFKGYSFDGKIIKSENTTSAFMLSRGDIVTLELVVSPLSVNDVNLNIYINNNRQNISLSISVNKDNIYDKNNLLFPALYLPHKNKPITTYIRYTMLQSTNQKVFVPYGLCEYEKATEIQFSITNNLMNKADIQGKTVTAATPQSIVYVDHEYNRGREAWEVRVEGNGGIAVGGCVLPILNRNIDSPQLFVYKCSAGVMYLGGKTYSGFPEARDGSVVRFVYDFELHLVELYIDGIFEGSCNNIRIEGCLCPCIYLEKKLNKSTFLSIKYLTNKNICDTCSYTKRDSFYYQIIYRYFSIYNYKAMEIKQEHMRKFEGKTLKDFDVFEEMGHGASSVVYKMALKDPNRTELRDNDCFALKRHYIYVPESEMETWKKDFFIPLYTPFKYLTQSYYMFQDEVINRNETEAEMPDIISCNYMVNQLRCLDLKTYLEKYKYEAKEVLLVLLQLSYTIAHLYKHGMCYVDLKPDNIMLFNVGLNIDISLVDFGYVQSCLIGPIITANATHVPPSAVELSTSELANSGDQKPLYNFSKYDSYSIGVLAFELSGIAVEGNSQQFLTKNPFLGPQFETDADLWQKIYEFAIKCIEPNDDLRPDPPLVVKLLQQTLWDIPISSCEREQKMCAFIYDFYERNNYRFDADPTLAPEEELQLQMVWDYIHGEGR
ncbi:hypothetical protein WA158_000331 [Blastocystis sp. Blastoise]